MSADFNPPLQATILEAVENKIANNNSPGNASCV